jgi:large subunit ribosomal protein L23
MAIFGNKTEENDEKKEEKISEVKPAKKTAVKKIAKTEGGEITETRLGIVKNDVIIEPWITEKSHDVMAQGKYIFRVRKEADKKKIKSAVEALYSVKVTDVNVVNIHSKKRNYGRHTGKKAGYKKAIVKLKEGDKIELFKGV